MTQCQIPCFCHCRLLGFVCLGSSKQSLMLWAWAGVAKDGPLQSSMRTLTYILPFLLSDHSTMESSNYSPTRCLTSMARYERRLALQLLLLISQNQVVCRLVCNPYHSCLYNIYYISYLLDITQFVLLLYEMHTLTLKIP